MFRSLKRSAYTLGDRGISSVEFALGGTALLFALLGVIELQSLFGSQNALSYAADRAGRYAVVHGSTSKSPASWNSVANVALASLPSYVNQSNIQVSVSAPPSSTSPGGNLTVSLVYNWAPTALSFLGTVSVSAQVIYIMQN